LAAIGEFNEDGVVDLAVSYYSDSAGVLIGDGVGGFELATDAAVGRLPSSVAAGDFDGDGATDVAAANEVGNSVTVLFNQLAHRADVNGSNRIDGFDVAAVIRLAGSEPCDPPGSDCGSVYRSNVDVDANGVIDGDDLHFVSMGFGELVRLDSPLRIRLDPTQSPAPGTVGLREKESEGDLLTVEVLVNDIGPSAVAVFFLTFEPTDDGDGQLLDYVGFEPGTYLGALQYINIDSDTPGRVRVVGSRITGAGGYPSRSGPLLSLFLTARREGEAVLRLQELVLSDELNNPLLDITSGDEVNVTVESAAVGQPQKIGYFPATIDFGDVTPGESVRRALRISNFGFSELEVSSVTSNASEFTSFFTAPFTIPPFGFVELTVVFSPVEAGVFPALLTIRSNDPSSPEVEVGLLGRSVLNRSSSPRGSAECGVVSRLVERVQRTLIATGSNDDGTIRLLESRTFAREKPSPASPGPTAVK
jgi:hypothetical protein